MIEVAGDGDCAHVMTDSADTMRWQQRGDRSLDPLPDLSLFTVEKDPEHICARHSVDVTVTQVDAEQVRVCGVLVLVEGFEPPLDRF